MSERLHFSLLGHPVRDSVLPAMHRAALRALGLPHSYNAIDVPSEASLRRTLEEIRRGAASAANITLPYGRMVMEMVDEAAPSAAEVGAANVIMLSSAGRLVAHNTDVAALHAELAAHCPPPRARRAVIIGAGGAGLAAIVAARRLGFTMIGVTTRSWSGSESTLESTSAEKARRLGALTSPWPTSKQSALTTKGSQALRMQWRELAARADLVIQATSAGMSGGDSGDEVCGIVPWDKVPSHAVLFDVICRPRATPFLKAARARGLHAEGGLGALVRQAELSFTLWTGRAPPPGVMRLAAEQTLEAGP